MASSAMAFHLLLRALPWRSALLLACLAAAPLTAAMAASPYVARCSVQAEDALRRINAARAAGQRCGWRRMPPAPPLRWNTSLLSAATAHSRDMASRNYFDHRSPEGRTVSERVTASRYKWKLVGENLAGGDRSVAGAVQGWIASPDHCQNLMNPKFADVALACVARPGSQWGTYWTMVLGRR